MSPFGLEQPQLTPNHCLSVFYFQKCPAVGEKLWVTIWISVAGLKKMTLVILPFSRNMNQKLTEFLQEFELVVMIHTEEAH